ncbi:MAG TPA: autotransporter-associated beta strand repeat-containing protein [Verrucomicrobiae bacterium]|nr:autotransporter-associated beta strand repeat-containing protein [Verrucomicrobiae bacterium]
MRKTLLLTPALLAALSLPALGADTWISTITSAWQTSGNWSTGVVPAATTPVAFQDSSTIITSVDLGGSFPGQAQGLTFGAYTGGTGFTIFSSGSQQLNLRAGGTPNGIQNDETATQTINAPILLYSSSGGTGSSASQTWNAASGALVFSGSYNAGLATVNLQGGTLTIDGGFNTTIGTGTGRGDIANGSLIKNGIGTLTLGGTHANAYTGTTTVNAGTIQAGKVNAFGTGQLLLNGGTVNTGDYNQSFGTLNLQGNATLDLSPTGTNSLTFSDSHSINWASGAVLTIDGWTSGDTLRFGSSGSALTAGQLSQIYFNITGDTQASIDPATGFITPVPEPSTLAFCIVGGFGLTLAITSRRRKS